MYDWTDFDPTLVGPAHARSPDLPPPTVALAHRIWGRLHGSVSLEIYATCVPGPPTRAGPTAPKSPT
ncbi:hypothetical protein [Embleya sp. NPDC050493]|uniref:hypothetical protein n=1 Tax=Embleya sp. NPDC050493 TaxID=3363989 RepID=UPI0037A351DF